ARNTVRGLSAHTSLSAVVEKLKPLLQASPCVAWWKRLAVVLICAAPAIVLGAIIALGGLLVQHWKTEQPELMPLMICLAMHEDLEGGKTRAAHPEVHPNDAEQRAALEVH